ncbi:hypothetical protein VNG_2177H [Halobacterium salinarum NRC-1]|uniref:Uncharacterized protein n=2 Tax=Halobacterium salinarum NRC-34001 TaxID=2886895 RepID=Q9HNA9_HALSA|nr:hypothetical protein VNG_2177H [Halobacterium salinarum NRC-1]CAP14609.1 uncharacterized protein OE_4044R [Halobacterium salinarum R1]DAC79060.1 TPA_inf: uncharacterized protein VNG_2177H [Halobacterium salinarum NRC-1]
MSSSGNSEKSDLGDILSEIESTGRSVIDYFRDFRDSRSIWTQIAVFWFPPQVALSYLIPVLEDWLISTFDMTNQIVTSLSLRAGLEERLMLTTIGIILITAGGIYYKLLTVETLAQRTLKNSRDG